MDLSDCWIMILLQVESSVAIHFNQAVLTQVRDTKCPKPSVMPRLDKPLSRKDDECFAGETKTIFVLLHKMGWILLAEQGRPANSFAVLTINDGGVTDRWIKCLFPYVD